MNTKSFLVTMAILASSACAPVATQAPVAAPTASAVAGQAAPAGQKAGQLAVGRGTIVGTITTNPWHNIKAGGVVYLEDGPKDGTPPRSGILDNHDMAFVPNIVVIEAGGSVIFTNTDPMVHNVFSPDGEKWNLGELPQNASVVKRFDNVGVYAILCNLHTNMLAYLVVAPSNHFTRTDPEGGFVLKDVPPGTYRVTAWVPRLKPVTQTVTVGGGESTLNFEVGR